MQLNRLDSDNVMYKYFTIYGFYYRVETLLTKYFYNEPRILFVLAVI